MKNQILKKIYRAVVYLRLSDEDGDNRESDSISNQRILIHSFLKSHPEIQVVKECVDDGYTGTNFNRPGFQEMLRMLEEGKQTVLLSKTFPVMEGTFPVFYSMWNVSCRKWVCA